MKEKEAHVNEFAQLKEDVAVLKEEVKTLKEKLGISNTKNSSSTDTNVEED